MSNLQNLNDCRRAQQMGVNIACLQNLFNTPVDFPMPVDQNIYQRRIESQKGILTSNLQNLIREFSPWGDHWCRMGSGCHRNGMAGDNIRGLQNLVQHQETSESGATSEDLSEQPDYRIWRNMYPRFPDPQRLY
jgi:hypothetical protein